MRTYRVAGRPNGMQAPGSICRRVSEPRPALWEVPGSNRAAEIEPLLHQLPLLPQRWHVALFVPCVYGRRVGVDGHVVPGATVDL